MSTTYAYYRLPQTHVGVRRKIARPLHHRLQKPFFIAPRQNRFIGYSARRVQKDQPMTLQHEHWISLEEYHEIERTSEVTLRIG